jgi:hypothetical protein
MVSSKIIDENTIPKTADKRFRSCLKKIDITPKYKDNNGERIKITDNIDFEIYFPACSAPHHKKSSTSRFPPATKRIKASKKTGTPAKSNDAVPK